MYLKEHKILEAGELRKVSYRHLIMTRECELVL